jgi:hypothetical protein
MHSREGREIWARGVEAFTFAADLSLLLFIQLFFLYRKHNIENCREFLITVIEISAFK